MVAPSCDVPAGNTVYNFEKNFWVVTQECVAELFWLARCSAVKAPILTGIYIVCIYRQMLDIYFIKYIYFIEDMVENGLVFSFLQNMFGSQVESKGKWCGYRDSVHQLRTTVKTLSRQRCLHHGRLCHSVFSKLDIFASEKAKGFTADVFIDQKTARSATAAMTFSLSLVKPASHQGRRSCLVVAESH